MTRHRSTNAFAQNETEKRRFSCKMSRRIHPAFQSKTVVKLECKYCERSICARGMRALLLADTKVELYSTDLPPEKWAKCILTRKNYVSPILCSFVALLNAVSHFFQLHSVNRNRLLHTKLWMSDQRCCLSRVVSVDWFSRWIGFTFIEHIPFSYVL